MEMSSKSNQNSFWTKQNYTVTNKCYHRKNYVIKRKADVVLFLLCMHHACIYVVQSNRHFFISYFKSFCLKRSQKLDIHYSMQKKNLEIKNPDQMVHYR